MTERSVATMPFGEVVRRAVVCENGRPVVAIAAALGVTPGSFNARLRGSGRFSPEEIATLVREIPDERLARWLFAGSCIMVVKYPATICASSDGTLFARSMVSVAETVDLLFDLLPSFNERWPDRPDVAETEALVDRLLGEVLAIRLHITGHRCADPADRRRPERFAPLAAHMLLNERQLCMRELSDSLGLNYHTLHARMTGRVPFAPSELRRLFQVYPEPCLADFFLAETPNIAMLVPAIAEAEDYYTPLQACLLSLRALVRFATGLGRIAETPPSAAEHAIESVNDALRQLATVRWGIGHIGRHPPVHHGVPTRQGQAAWHNR